MVSLFKIFSLLFLHFYIQTTGSPFSSTLLSPPEQSHALLRFKNSFSVTLAAPKIESWIEGTDCCSWAGVTCDIQTGYVIGLNLSGSSLYGPIHSDNSLFSLSHLQMLDLSCNDFNGSQISYRFGYLFNLMHLNLSSSNFAGQVPSEFSLLSSLVSLDLSWNFVALETNTFNKIFQNLTKLKKVSLSGVNMLKVAPSSFMNLSSSLSSLQLGSSGLGQNFADYVPPLPSRLLSLDLSENDMRLNTTTFVRIFRSMSNLRKLDLSYLDLSLVESSSFLNLTSSLLYLNLRECRLTGTFPHIFHLSKLNSIDLSSNDQLSIDGIAFNRFVRNLTSLREVDFEGVNMSLVKPIYLQNISSSLSSLSLIGCGLRGEFPGSLVQRPNLRDLELYFNEDLKGFLPGSNWSTSLSVLDLYSTELVVPNLELFGSLTQLYFIQLPFGNISGQIPSCFQNLKRLSTLHIAHNNLTGHLPNYFANFTLLKHLTLSNNQLTGPIPSLSHLNYLNILDLSNNMLNGTIPSFLFTLPNLYYLNLKNNQLHGPIPSFQSNAFQYINLSNNLLHGPIPNSIFNMIYLLALILSSNNKLIGEVSSSLCRLQFLKILDLSNNSFIGSIPPCLGNLNLSALHLGINNFEGTIPNTFSKDCKLRYLNFKGNQLEGQVPPSMINCTDLELIDLSNNKINDTFPHFLGILPQLQGLVIHSNKFHGLVKRSNLSYPFLKLRIFDLSNNSFKGPLPANYFDHFEAMMNSDHQMSYMRLLDRYSYDYSVSLSFKGLEIELLRIQTTLTTVDFSSNSFSGKIPKSIAKLKSLILLNLSHNYLTNDIPPSFANLTNLESLDLSSNLLSGRIPSNLVDLTFLQVFNVAHNLLEGPIPEGKQFNTFDNNSYEGNLGLYGFPLENCNNGETQHPTPSEQEEAGFEDGFGWKAVAMGYGCGAVIGLAMGYIVFRTRKPAWFVRMVEGERNRRPKRFRKNSKTHGRRN